jgi:hypothetical protein
LADSSTNQCNPNTNKKYSPIHNTTCYKDKL